MVPLPFAAIAVAACSGSPREISVSSATRAAVLELGSSHPDLQMAEIRLQDRCLRAHGYSIPEFVATAVLQPSVNLSGALGLLTVEEARREGYGSRIGQPQSDADPVASFMARMSDDDRVTFDLVYSGGDSAKEETVRVGDMVAGASTEGCVAKARTAIYGSISNFLRLTYLPGEIVGIGSEIVNSPEARRAFDSYAACMRAHGIDVRNLNDVRDLANERFGARGAYERATANEISLAVQDATCQEKSGLRESLNDETVRRASSYIAAHEAELLALREILSSARTNARIALERLGQ